MKKLTYLFAGLIMVALVVSCSKEATDDTAVNLKDAVIDKPSLPESDGGVFPVILAVDKPKGGNVTCSDVAQAYATSFDLCGDKLDYDGMKFNGTFPLNVTVEGLLVSFSTDGGNCIQIGDKFYKVGAVIVKGGNAANVYFYEGGTLSDSGLASPINASGQPAALSNLTFCFVECKEKLPELVIVLKTYLQSTDQLWTGTYGTGSDVNRIHLGYIKYLYDVVNDHQLYLSAVYTTLPAGTLTAKDYIDPIDGFHYLEIVLSNPYLGYPFTDTYLYVGTAEGYDEYLSEIDGVIWTDYQSFPFQNDEIKTSKTFKIPFSQITE